MLTSKILRLTAAAALTALAGASQAFEATGQNPPANPTIMTTSPDARYVLVYPAYSPTPRSRAEVIAEMNWARSQGLLNDTGEAGASDRVLERREAFPETERRRVLVQMQAERDAVAVPYEVIVIRPAP